MDTPEGLTKRFLSLNEVGEELGFSPGHVYALVRTGSLRAVKLGGHGQWRVERASLEDFIARSYEATSDYVSTHPFTLPPSADPARVAVERDDGPAGP